MDIFLYVPVYGESGEAAGHDGNDHNRRLDTDPWVEVGEAALAHIGFRRDASPCVEVGEAALAHIGFRRDTSPCVAVFEAELAHIGNQRGTSSPEVGHGGL